MISQGAVSLRSRTLVQPRRRCHGVTGGSSTGAVQAAGAMVSSRAAGARRNRVAGRAAARPQTPLGAANIAKLPGCCASSEETIR